MDVDDLKDEQTCWEAKQDHFKDPLVKHILAIVALVLIAGGILTWYQWEHREQGNQAIAENNPGFSLSVKDSIKKIAVGGTVSYEPQVAFLNGFNSTQTNLWVKDVPPGITATYELDPLPHQGASVLTLRGDGSEKPGTYILTMGATAEGLTHTQNITLVVSGEPDFRISISPTTQAVAAEEIVSYELTLTSINEFSDPVTLSVSDIPNGVSTSFAPKQIIPSATSILTITTSGAAPQGEYPLLVTATNGNNSHSIQAVLNVTAPGSAWTISPIGQTGSKNNTVRVGPARNDNIDRVYVGTIETGRVIEFSWNGTRWSGPVDIGGSLLGEEIHNMTIGPGRNDGILRIYVASIDDNLYELTYNGSGWKQTAVGTPGGDAFHAVVGNGRNDGINRLYASRGTRVWEYTWTGTDWNSVLIGEVSGGVAHGMAIGNGRNEGKNRIYVASTGSGVYEAIFYQGAWSLVKMGDWGDVRNVSVGPGRNDGIQRIYGALLKEGGVREFTWNKNRWSFKNLTDHVGEQLVHAYILPGRGDGVYRVYSSGGKGNSYEFTWNGSSWTKYTLGGGIGYMYGFHFGQSRNNDITRLYGGSFDTRIYEYTWSAPTKKLSP